MNRTGILAFAQSELQNLSDEQLFLLAEQLKPETIAVEDNGTWKLAPLTEINALLSEAEEKDIVAVDKDSDYAKPYCVFSDYHQPSQEWGELGSFSSEKEAKRKAYQILTKYKG
ncbi:hypothetical protein [Vibrio crassostreae]|uniref:hypothetical protein n=1 Tax=Vibrio crassostreae TaxID=246167 RepID=UPI001B30C1FD|nr:hypothetical protein [Vibrio crassostreae]